MPNSTIKISIMLETSTSKPSEPSPVNRNSIAMINAPTMDREEKRPVVSLYSLKENDGKREIEPSPAIVTINNNSFNWCSPCCNK